MNEFQGTDLYIAAGTMAMPGLPADPKAIHYRRHLEWREHNKKWRWLLDSYEGGQRYRNAIYGYDTRGMPIYNLVRHKREYPDARETAMPATGAANAVLGADPNQKATDDDFEMRRARTPVPTFVREAVEEHIGKIYAREVHRTGPADLIAFWKDVDGAGTTIDEWMQDVLAPILLVCGCVDVLFDHPEGDDPESEAERQELGLDRCILKFVLPENVVWWELDDRGRYEQVLIFEVENEHGQPQIYYRLWDAEGWHLYRGNGELVSERSHAFGRVPIVRLFDRRSHRCPNVGHPRYEGVAERQREFYNRDSELILSDTTQAHPLLQGPEDYVQADGTVPIGPAWLLPKKKNNNGSTTQYEGFDVVEFPKEGAASLRQNKADLRDEVDRDCKITKPAGLNGISKGQVEQSGISKNLDMQAAHELLSQIAKALRKAESIIAEYALVVLHDGGEPDTESYQIVYPTSFDLYTASDVGVVFSDLQNLLDKSGNLPDGESALLKRHYRLVYPGQSDDFYAGVDAEIDAFMAKGGGIGAKMERAQQAIELTAKMNPTPETPAGNVRNTVKDNTQRLQPPGQGGKPKVKDEPAQDRRS